LIALCGAFSVLVLTAGLAAACLRLAQATAYALAVYVFAWTEVVMLGEALSLTHAAGTAGYAVALALLLAAALGAWHLRGRPRPPRPVLRPLNLRRHPLLVLLALAVGAALVYEAFVVVATPPNNFDSMTYHLSRAAAWYQDGGIHFLNAHTARENLLPPNSELGILFTFVFLGRDTFAAAPQFLAELAVLAAIYGCARRLLFPRSGALFAALTTATLTEFALQSVTTQNDLVTAAFVSCGAFFLLGRSRRELPLAALALGLALGTKTTAAFALPALVLLALAVVPRRRLVELAAWSAAAFAAVGAYGYVLNLRETGHVIPSSPEFARFHPRVTAAGTISTGARVLYRFVDLSGYYKTPFQVLWGIDQRGEEVFHLLRIDPNPPEATSASFGFYPNRQADEDISYFGVLGVLLVLPLAFGYAGALVLRRTSAARGLVGLALPLYVLALAVGYAYNPWIGRFMLVPVALAMPLAARLYPFRLLAGIAAVVAIGTLGAAHAYNRTKPTGLFGGTPIWRMSRPEAQGLTSPYMAGAIAALDQRVPARARVAVVFASDDWDYPVYGPELERRPVEFTSVGAAERSGLHWLVLGDGVRPPRSGGWRSELLANRWTLVWRLPAAQLAAAGAPQDSTVTSRQ